MTKRDKRLQKLRQSPQHVSFAELKQILEEYGFTVARVTGSHHIFVAELGDQVWKLTIPFHKPLKIAYVKLALVAIDEIRAVLDSMDEEKSDGRDTN